MVASPRFRQGACVESRAKSGVSWRTTVSRPSPLTSCTPQEATRQRTAPCPHRHALTALGIGGIIGTGIFVLTGTGGRPPRRSRTRPLLHRRRFRLHPRGAVLRRIRLDDSGLRQRLLLLLRDPRRRHRLVHRLEPGTRVPVCGRHRVGRVVGLPGELLLGTARDPHARLHSRTRPSMRWETRCTSSRTGAIINLPAMLIVAAAHRDLLHRHPTVGDVQHRHRGHQGHGRPAVHRASVRATSTRPTGIRSSRRTPGSAGKYGCQRNPGGLGHHLLRLHRL